MRRVCGAVVGVYAVLCVLALLVVPLSAIGAFGIEPDPLAAVSAMLLALPWSLLLDLVASDDNMIVNLALVALAMIINGAIMVGLCRFARNR